MRIAQVAPLYESVPPKAYGGTELVVSYLTEELVRSGHEVTLFASADSSTLAHLRPACDRALRKHTRPVDPIANHMRLLEMVAQEARHFDVVHFHTDYLHFPITRRSGVTALTTLHGRLDLPDLVPIYREFTDMRLVSITNAQRKPIPWANWVATIHHGVRDDLYQLQEHPGKYLAFLGRLCPEKRVDRAIEIAQRVGMPLRIAAKIDPVDGEYFESQIKRLLDNPLVEYLGEIEQSEKPDFLGNAYALLFPIDWPEPFGLVMIEAMACGTPVIAWPWGSVPEIMENGKTGYIVDSVDAAVKAVERAGALDRKVCRGVFEERFTARRMCRDYCNLFERLLDRAPARCRPVTTRRVAPRAGLGAGLPAPQPPVGSESPATGELASASEEISFTP